MVHPVSAGQAAEVISRIATNIDWAKLQPGILQMHVIQMQPEELGRRFTAFIHGGCKLHVVESAFAFQIDRPMYRGISSDYFAPEFIIEEEDERAHLIRVLNFDKGVLFLNEGPSCREVHKTVTLGDEIEMLKTWGLIRLDAQIGKDLHAESFQYVLRWMFEERGFRNIVFPGTILRKVSDNSLHAMVLSIDVSTQSLHPWSIGTRALTAPSDPAYVVPGIHMGNLLLWSAQAQRGKY